jgi:heat-inducible transcriptional repressor
MEARQLQLLTLVIENYIATAEPVGSRFLVEKAGLDWSEATVRNELRELEEEGFLTHPHTSAGRIPTLKGYSFYLSDIDYQKFKVTKKDEELLAKAYEAISEHEQRMKNLAKALVEVSDETVLVAFSPEKVYYTGLANLFQKPDFAEMRLVASVSEVFDRCEEALPGFYGKVKNEPKFYLGREHPFGEMLSVVAARFGESGQSLITLLGPQRMNYKKNWALLNKVLEII